jgi:beta-lactamase class D
MKTSILGLVILGLMVSCFSQGHNKRKFIKDQTDSVIVRSDFHKYFKDCGVDGSMAIYDNYNKKWILSDTSEVNLATLPASTFKVVNLLIALETQTITDENEIVKWVGSTDTVKYGYRPEIYHDMTVKEAFEVSAGWVFVELAKKIGKENYRKYLKLTGYGNGNLSQTDADFWNFGAFGISPINQVDFLRKLYENKLPFSKKNMAIVKKVMINEQRTDFVLRAKTGWTRDKGINTGWWIGYIEKEENAYFFATRLLQDRKNNRADFGNCRKEITKKILKEIGVLEQ